jgi:hypothetical protein
MKLTEEYKVRLDEGTSLRFMRRAAQAGCAPGELIRDLICELEYGVTWGEHVAESRRSAMRREGAIACARKPEHAPQVIDGTQLAD